MKICFFNLNGSPREVENAKSKFASYNLKVGDFVVFCDKFNLCFSRLDKNIDVFRIDDFTLLDICSTNTLCNYETNIVFQFDNIFERGGNVGMINYFITTFHSEPISSLLIESVNILNNNIDTFSAKCLFDVYKTNDYRFDNERTEEYVFLKFFSEKLKAQYISLLKEGLSIKEIYKQLKSTNAVDFSESMKSFKKEFPNNTIYDVVFNEACHIIVENKSKNNFYRCVGFKKVYKVLEDNKLIQISDTDWTDGNGQIYFIDIHPKQ